MKAYCKVRNNAKTFDFTLLWVIPQYLYEFTKNVQHNATQEHTTKDYAASQTLK